MLHSRFRVRGRTISSSRIYKLLTNKEGLTMCFAQVFFLPFHNLWETSVNILAGHGLDFPFFPCTCTFSVSFVWIPFLLILLFSYEVWLFLSLLQENRGLGSKMTDSKYFTTTKKGLLFNVFCFSLKILVFYGRCIDIIWQ